MTQIKQTFYLSKIGFVPSTPIQMFKSIISKLEGKPILMNVATVDKEFGVLNRSVMYRGLTQEDPPHIIFVTEKISRKYQNLKENPKLSLTILCDLTYELWQIRLLNAEAVELEGGALKNLWQEEPLYAKIRSHICKCGKPNNGQELEAKYQEIYERYERDLKEPQQTSSYTAFKIIPKHWDFYMSEPNKIADRIQYKYVDGEMEKWDVYHADA